MTPLHLRSPDHLISGNFYRSPRTELPLLVLIHGGGCNGRYFELAGNSAVAAGHARGFPVLVLDRSGHGGNDTLTTDSPIAETAPLIRMFIDQVRAEQGLRARGVALVGHSIGGALAITMAAERGDWPLAAIAVSGIGDDSPPEIRAITLPEGVSHVAPDPALTDGLFYDPERTLKWKAVASLRAAAEDWLVAEVREVVERWPARWRGLAGLVDVPVHLRLAEHERIWVSGPEVVARMASAFTHAPEVNAGLLPGGGHLYEATKGGAAFIAAQLDFIARHAAR